MAYLQNILTWTKDTFLPLGPYGLFFLSIIESIFFPVPPEVILIPLCLSKPSLSLWYGIIASIGSVLGGFVGYSIGYYGGKRIFLRLFGGKNFLKMHRQYDKYGIWAVIIAGFTPMPYKIISIGSGILYIKFWKFLIASVVSRAPRFMTSALLLYFYGESVVGFIENYLEMIFYALALLAVLIIIYYLYKNKEYIRKKLRRKNKKLKE